MKYDMIVVGGRIGGSVSSLIASQNDLDVLMIEKRQEIGTPVQCAEGTTYQTFETLDMKPSKKYICSDIEGAMVHAPDGRSIDLFEYGLMLENFTNEKTKGCILDRKIFDKHLAIQSAKAGTEIMVKTTVKDLIIKDGRICGVVAKHLGKTMEIHSDIVIAADGVESNMTRLAGLDNPKNPKDICSCAQYELVGLDVDPHWLHFYFGREIAPGGYLWIFPKGKESVNLGLGIRSPENTAYHYLKKFTAKLDATPVELNIGGVPLSGPIDKTYTDGLLVVGDAAGQVDPITGGGIHITASCAKIAGEVAARAIKMEDTSAKTLQEYDILWRKEFEEGLKTSLKYRKAADKLSDKDMNALAEYFVTNHSENFSKLGAIKFLGKHPHLLKLIKEFL
ncbi:MAG: NAD(P)/FAD-dependent oxidoreductase [Methanobacterium sp.]|nr:NAD(P)/FAD-dependent oxidoreductase [Methanobacterium sp.]